MSENKVEDAKLDSAEGWLRSQANLLDMPPDLENEHREAALLREVADRMLDLRKDRDRLSEENKRLREALDHAVLTAEDPVICAACHSPGDDNCPVMRERNGETSG